LVLLCDERSQFQIIFQLLGATKAVVFFTPLPINISIAGSFVELFDKDFEGVIEGVSAKLGVAVGSGALLVILFVFVVCESVEPRQPVQMSTNPTIVAAMSR